MMKWFRKHTNKLLAVFTALLLVVWLGGQALRDMFTPNPNDQPLGQAYGKKIYEFDRRYAQQETTLLARLGIPWSKPWVGSDFRALQYDFNEPITELEWVLLKEEADDIGADIPLAQVNKFKQALGASDQAVRQIAARHSVSVDTINVAIANYLRILNAFAQVKKSVRVTEPELRTLAKMNQEKVEVKWIGLPAEAFVDEEQPVTEDEIQQQFNALRDTPAGEGEYGAGFKYPDRVRIEYIVANVDAVAPTVTISREEAKEYWKRNKETFLKPDSKDAEPEKTAESQPATVDYYETFMEAENDVVARLQQQRAPAETQRLLNELLATQFVPDWGGLEPGRGGFRTAPDVVKADDYLSDRIERFVDQYPQYIDVFSVHRTDLLTKDLIQKEPGLGKAMYQAAGANPFMSRRIPVSFAAFDVEGLVEPPDETLARSADRPIAKYEFSPHVFRGDKGTAYAFRVIEVVPTVEPDSVNEVRDEVIRSIRLARGYEAARRKAQEMLQTAEGSNFEFVWNMASELKEAIESAKAEASGVTSTAAWGRQTPPPFAREQFNGDPSFVLGLQSKELIDTCFSAAESIPSAEAKRPLTVVDVPKSRIVLLIQVEKLLPVYEETFQAQRGRLTQGLENRRENEIARAWFAKDNIYARTGFKPS